LSLLSYLLLSLTDEEGVPLHEKKEGRIPGVDG
jgi:hypothetical protein